MSAGSLGGDAKHFIFLLKKKPEHGEPVHACDPSTPEMKVRLELRDHHLRLPREFWAKTGYTRSDFIYLFILKVESAHGAVNAFSAALLGSSTLSRRQR